MNEEEEEKSWICINVVCFKSRLKIFLFNLAFKLLVCTYILKKNNIFLKLIHTLDIDFTILFYILSSNCKAP